MWYVYILECKNKALYTGITNDLKRRLKEHQSGRGGHYTYIFGTSKILWREKHSNRSSAMKREAQIKRWTRRKKIALIKGNLELLKKL
jgi:predicted GIY-YIG superfamily endonuclease